MKKAYILILASAALITVLSGCTGSRWHKPGSTQADFNRDSAECLHFASAYARENTMGMGKNPVLFSKAYNNCLTRRGWKKFIGNKKNTGTRLKKEKKKSYLFYNSTQNKIKIFGMQVQLPTKAIKLHKKESLYGPVSQTNYSFTLPEKAYFSVIAQQSKGVVFENKPYPAKGDFFVYDRGTGELKGNVAKWTFFCGKIKGKWVGGLGIYVFPQALRRAVITLTREIPDRDSHPPEDLRLTQVQYRAMEKLRSYCRELFPGLYPKAKLEPELLQFNFLPE